MEEPDAGGDGADGHQDLHPPRGPGPGGVGERRAGRRRAPWRRSPSSRRSRRGRRRRRWPPARRPGRPAAAGSNPRAPPAGWPAGPPRRGSRRHAPRASADAAPAGPATARARRRPALRRSATAPRTGPDRSRVPSRTGAPPSSRPTTGAQGALGHALGRVGVRRQLHGDRHGLGRRPLQLAHHQLARHGPSSANGPGAGCRRARTGGRRGAGPRRTGAARGRRPVPSSGCSRGGCGPAAARRDVERRRAGGACTRRVHHCSANGAADATSSVTESWTPRRTGTQHDGIVGRAPPARRARRTPRARAVRTGRTRTRRRDVDPQPRPAGRRCRQPARCARLIARPRHHHERARRCRSGGRRRRDPRGPGPSRSRRCGRPATTGR